MGECRHHILFDDRTSRVRCGPLPSDLAAWRSVADDELAGYLLTRILFARAYRCVDEAPGTRYYVARAPAAAGREPPSAWPACQGSPGRSTCAAPSAGPTTRYSPTTTCCSCPPPPWKPPPCPARRQPRRERSRRGRREMLANTGPRSTSPAIPPSPCRAAPPMTAGPWE